MVYTFETSYTCEKTKLITNKCCGTNLKYNYNLI